VKFDGSKTASGAGGGIYGRTSLGMVSVVIGRITGVPGSTGGRGVAGFGGAGGVGSVTGTRPVCATRSAPTVAMAASEMTQAWKSVASMLAPPIDLTSRLRRDSTRFSSIGSSRFGPPPAR